MAQKRLTVEFWTSSRPAEPGKGPVDLFKGRRPRERSLSLRMRGLEWWIELSLGKQKALVVSEGFKEKGLAGFLDLAATYSPVP